MPIAAFSVNHVCPFKYHTRHSEIEQNSDLHLAWRKINNANKMPLINHKIAQKQSLYNELFTESRKNTFRMWKTTEMTFYFLTEIQTIMDKSLGTNLHLWRFFTHAKQIHLHLFSPSPSYNVRHVYTLFLQSLNIVLGGGGATHFKTDNSAFFEIPF